MREEGQFRQSGADLVVQIVGDPGAVAFDGAGAFDLIESTAVAGTEMPSAGKRA